MTRLIQRTDGGDVAHELLFHITSIGRGALNDIVIDDPGERRLHARIVALGGGRYAVVDNRSRTGVTVNGERVEAERALAPGDVLRVGEAQFAFEPTGEAAPKAARARSLAGGVLKLTAGTLVSRLLGLAREMVAMAYFGASGIFDAYVAATTLPNLFRDVLGEHAAESAFMPAHKTLVLRGREGEARRLARSILGIVVISGLVLVVLGVALAPWLMTALVPRFAKEHPRLLGTATSLARWMMPFLAIVAVAAVFGSLLLAERRFLRYALAPAGASVCLIAAIVALTGRLGAGSLAVGVVVGGLVQMVVCAAPYLRRRGGLFGGGPLVDWQQPALRKVGRGVVPIALSGVLNKFIWIVDRVLANWFCAAGRLTALYVSHRLLQLPFGVVGLAVGRAAFPSLIEEASAQEGDGFSRAVVRAMRLNVFLMLPATIGLVVLAAPFVGLILERGRFTAEHSQWVAVALVCYAVGLAGMGARTVLTRAFYALLNTRTPLYLSAIAIATNAALSVALVLTPLEHGGLALASSIATWLQVVLLVLTLRREVARRGRRLSFAGLGSGMLRVAVSGLVMACGTWGTLMLLVRAGLSAALLGKALCVVVPGMAGLVLYFGAALLLRCDEVAEVRQRLLDRLRAGR